MDDLLGEDWQKPAKPNTSTNNPPLNYTSLRASPANLPQSGTPSPLSISRPSSTSNNNAKPSGSDAFGSLLGSKAQKATNSNISIQERQRQLVEERKRQQEQQAAMWDTLGSGRGTPEIRGPSPATLQGEEDDIMAAFNKDAPVNKASHFPPPLLGAPSGRNTPASQFAVPAAPKPEIGGFDDNDDPFGLSSLPKQTNGHVPPNMVDDDDILGDLGKPFMERPARQAAARSEPRLDEPEISFGAEEPQDRALAELVDMGFPVDNAKIALAESGGDVQGAVGWLLQQAHEESKQKARAEAGERHRSPPAHSRSPHRQPREQDGVPAWMRQESRPTSAARRQDSRSPAGSATGAEKDPAQVAQEYGSKLFKGATSLWKAGQKQVAKTVAEFQQERDPSQPRWMQEVASDSSRSNSQRRREADATDEAAMLDGPRERPQKPQRPAAGKPDPPRPNVSSPAEPLPHRPAQQPRFMQQTPPLQDKRPTAKISKQEVEEQSAQAYVSPARRKRPVAKPDPHPESEVDLFSPAPPKASPAVTPQPKAASRPSAPIEVRPKAPPRSIPSVSPAALATSANHRKIGGEAFKRGDYASAHESYTAALSPLPATHPIAVIVLSNRSLTALKTGDAKMAVSDADRAIEIIGASQGVGETIELGASEGTKEMRDFYGKALMRKAEALEHMEKWADAAAVWRIAVGAGVGGAVSIRGRDRCEKSAAPKPVDKPKPAPMSATPKGNAPPAKNLGNSLNRPALSTAKSTEAVKKLRAANLAADKADDEKFALTDQVEARLTTWKGGKADNLRSLLQSLDAVLWESAGWKKVGMSDLVLPNKVKIIYMKAIAKVHPDKISQDATTEQRMISAAVFSTLNEAWDKFKKDNNL